MYTKLLALNKQYSNFSGENLKAFCNVRRKKSDGGLPTKKNLLVVYANAMKNRAPMTVKEYLLDQGHPEALIDTVLANREDNLTEDDVDDEEESVPSDDEEEDEEEGDELSNIPAVGV